MTVGRMLCFRGQRYIQGWACGSTLTGDPTRVAAIQSGKIIGIAIASNFSESIESEGAPTSWCGFTMRIDALLPSKKYELSLVDYETNEVLDRATDLKIENEESPYTTITEVIANDPTALQSVENLECCGKMFDEYVAKNGPKKFINAAYSYILGRPSDTEGLIAYSQKLESGELTCFQILRIFAKSNEFSSRPRTLTSPASNGFPFR